MILFSVHSAKLRVLPPVIPAWWAQVDSNHRPRAYQARALTTWAMSPFSYYGSFSSPSCSLGGDDGNRTHDPLLAGQVLSQLSYTPICYGIWYRVQSAKCRVQSVSYFIGHWKLNNRRVHTLTLLTIRLLVCIYLNTRISLESSSRSP